MREGLEEEARELFNHLHEPNETCLGSSIGTPNGNAIGQGNANAIFESIKQSRALQTGLLEHLEDFRIFIPNIDKDKVSDMTTNIIRKHLIEYTNSQAIIWEIPLQNGVPSGDYWNRQNNRWEQEHTSMLIIDDRKILLVPKSIVSYAKKYSSQQFHQHYALNFLQHEHLRMNSVLVQTKRLKNGDEKKWVTKESIKDHEAPLEKEYLTEFTLRHNNIFEQFREGQRNKLRSLENSEFDARANLDEIIDHLKVQLSNIPTGTEDASNYHKTTAAILELLFYPRLTCLTLEVKLNEGRKRVDITFDNAAHDGIFWRLSAHHQIPCSYIFIECKNYGREIGNPEVDQLIGRFHANRGKFGMIVCRTLENRELLIKRCRDAYAAQQGIILPLTDSDLIQMLNLLKEGNPAPEEELLTITLREITLG